MVRSCTLLLGSLALVVILFFFAIFLPQYKQSISYLLVALLMTMIIGYSKASVFAKLVSWLIIWIAIGYILVF